MNWGLAQTPPLFKKSPFHRFGVRMNRKAETARDRRLTREEDKKLLDAALTEMNAPEHQFAGPLPHDRIIGALELCCRRAEMLPIQNKRVNWETHQIGIPGATPRTRRTEGFRSIRKDDSPPSSSVEGARTRRVRVRDGRRRVPAGAADGAGNAAPAGTRHRTRRGAAPRGIESNYGRSIYAGMT